MSPVIIVGRRFLFGIKLGLPQREMGMTMKMLRQCLIGKGVCREKCSGNKRNYCKWLEVI